MNDYDLTFKQALRAMLDGKVIQSEVGKSWYRLNKDASCIEDTCDGYWDESAGWWSNAQKGKWKVVE